LALRKNKAGQQGEVHPFTLRLVEAPEPDDDGQPITSMVVDWKAAAGTPNAAGTAPDPWAGARRQDQRTAALRLKKVLMSALAEQGVDRKSTAPRCVGRSGDDPRFSTGGHRRTDRQPKARLGVNSSSARTGPRPKLIASYEINDVVYLYSVITSLTTGQE
jgi:hypothetical protein